MITTNQSRTCTGLNGHVAQCHSTFHRQVGNRLTGELYGMPGTTGGANLADNSQYNILRSNSFSHRTVDSYAHVFGFILNQALCCQYMFYFRGTNTKCERGKGTMCGGMRISTNHCHAGQGGALLGTYDMHYTLANIAHFEFNQLVFITVLVKCFHLQTRNRVGNTFFQANGWNIVIGNSEYRFFSPDLSIGYFQTLKCLWRSHFVNQVPINI